MKDRVPATITASRGVDRRRLDYRRRRSLTVQNVAGFRLFNPFQFHGKLSVNGLITGSKKEILSFLRIFLPVIK